MKHILNIIILLLSIGVFSQSGKVIKIKDGDTIVVLDILNNQTTIRLAEIDCPESGQPFGKNAKQFTSDQVYLKWITYKVETKDRYGRTIGKVFYDKKYLSEELVKNGLAWHYKKYSNSKNIATLEKLARQSKKGLWSEKISTAPWDWRKIKN